MNNTKIKQLAKSVGGIADELLVQLHEDEKLYYTDVEDEDRQKVIRCLDSLDQLRVNLLELTHIKEKKDEEKDE
jgi:hypothetical protein